RGGMILTRKSWAQAIDKAVFPGIQGGPLMHVIAGKAVALGEALRPEFKEYARRVVDNAQALAETLIAEGLDLVSGGTDNHLMLVDLRNLGITGRDAERVLDEVRITVNKNAIPFDPNPPAVTSGIRIGTPAATEGFATGTPAATGRGMYGEAMRQIGRIIARVLKNPNNETVKAKARDEVAELTALYPIYEGRQYSCGATARPANERPFRRPR